MNWKELVGLVEQVFDDVVREDGAEFIICPECGEPIYEEEQPLPLLRVRFLGSIKTSEKRKKVLDKLQNL